MVNLKDLLYLRLENMLPTPGLSCSDSLVKPCSLFMAVFSPEKRQTMLFSATQTRKVEDLARISLKKEPLYVGVDDNKDNATVDGLEQVLAATCF